MEMAGGRRRSRGELKEGREGRREGGKEGGREGERETGP